jgi:hypothetical protein
MSNAAQATPAKPMAEAAPERPTKSSFERKNLALQLDQARQDPSPAEHAAASNVSSIRQEPLLEQAPESERSEALSMPPSEGDFSARQQFN